jgi:hypothetical protein
MSNSIKSLRSATLLDGMIDRQESNEWVLSFDKCACMLMNVGDYVMLNTSLPNCQSVVAKCLRASSSFFCTAVVTGVKSSSQGSRADAPSRKGGRLRILKSSD